LGYLNAPLRRVKNYECILVKIVNFSLFQAFSSQYQASRKFILRKQTTRFETGL